MGDHFITPLYQEGSGSSSSSSSSSSGEAASSSTDSPAVKATKKGAKPDANSFALSQILMTLMLLFTAITQTAMGSWSEVSNNQSTSLINVSNQEQTALQADQTKLAADTASLGPNPSQQQLQVVNNDQSQFSEDQSSYNLAIQNGQTTEQNSTGMLSTLASSSQIQTQCSSSILQIGSTTVSLLQHTA